VKAKEVPMTAPKLTEEEARAELLRPATGKCVVVVKVRKVHRDTTGIVFWEGEGGLHNQGARIGFKDAAGTAHWTAAHNVVVVVPGFDPTIASNDKPPAGHTWNELLQAHTPEVPSKGQQVRIKETSEEGEVFWVKGHRLGVRVGSGKDDVRWADASEVEVVKDKLQILQDFANGIGTPPPLGQGVPPLPPAAIPVRPRQPRTTGPSNWNGGFGVPEVEPPEGWPALPSPYSEIREVRVSIREDSEGIYEGVYEAYDANGDFLLLITDEIASLLQRRYYVACYKVGGGGLLQEYTTSVASGR